MEDLLEKIISLSKRRGIIFPSSQIYGGFGSCYDFGPLGAEIKRNIKEAWWREMIWNSDNVVGLDSSILMSPRVWEASGHLSGFSDELMECLNCHKRYKTEEVSEKKCVQCGGGLTEPRKFNLMMKTFVGALEDKNSTAYLRPETCQGIYVNFKNVLDSSRLKLPFGIAQIGKAFRNEITPKNFIFRMREFEQMEMQWFCSPRESDVFFEQWKEKRINWYLKYGVKRESLRMVEVPEDKRAHYAKRQIDLEYKFPFGWQEIEGIHNRGNWDLSRHQQFSGESLEYKDPDSGENYIPHIVETSVGVERSLLAFLADSYKEISGGRTKTTQSVKNSESMLNLNKNIAPVKVAVLPLLKNKKEIVKKAGEIYSLIKSRFMSQYDETGSIGRRYRRQDEIGTPVCLTVDFESIDKDDVTARNRDTMEQVRVNSQDLINYLKEFFD